MAKVDFEVHLPLKKFEKFEDNLLDLVIKAEKAKEINSIKLVFE